MNTKRAILAKRKMTGKQSAPSLDGRILSARRDPIDFRDKMYVPTLVEVPATRNLDSFLKHEPVILDQGQEGACTGFGLATTSSKPAGTAPTCRLSARACSTKWPNAMTSGPAKPTRAPAPAAR